MTIETSVDVQPPAPATTTPDVPQTPPAVSESSFDAALAPDEGPEHGPYVNPDRVADLKQNLLVSAQPLADQVMALRAYKMNGGNVDELAQENPALADAVLQLNARTERENQEKDAFFSQLATATEPISYQVLRQQMTTFEEAFKTGSDVLLTEYQRSQLKPEVLAEVVKAEEILLKEHLMLAQDKKLSLIQQVLASPDATDELKALATEEAKAALVDQAKSLTDIAAIEGADAADFAKLTEKAKELGLEGFDIEAEAAQVMEELEVDEQVMESAKENGFDYIQFLGLKDKDGKILKGKATIFGGIAALFILSDQFIAQAAGRQALLPMLVSIVSQVGNEVKTTQHMTHMKEADPASYAYYKQMGYGENYLLSWLLDYFKKKAAPKAG